MPTEFPRTPEHYRRYCDEFVAALRDWKDDPTWEPNKATRSRIEASARILYEDVRYQPGFVAWAFPKHMQTMSGPGKLVPYVVGPSTLRWLIPTWEQRQAAGDGRKLVGETVDSSSGLRYRVFGDGTREMILESHAAI